MDPKEHDGIPEKQLEPQQNEIVDRDLAEVFPPRNQFFTPREKLLLSCMFIIQQQIEVDGLSAAKSSDRSGVPRPLRELLPGLTDMLKEYDRSRQIADREAFDRKHPGMILKKSNDAFDPCDVQLHHLRLVKKTDSPKAPEQVFFTLEVRGFNGDWLFLDSTSETTVVASQHPVLTVVLSRNGGTGYTFLPIFSQEAVNRFIDRFIEPGNYFEDFPSGKGDNRRHLPPSILRHIQDQIFAQLDDSMLQRHYIHSPADIVVSSMDYTQKPDDPTHQFQHHYLAFCQVNQSFDVKCKVNPESGLLLDA